MEKKTRFKLKFIKNHLSKSQNHKLKARRSNKRLFLQKQSPKALVLYKYFNPISNHRIKGDLVFLDQTTYCDEYVGLNILWNSFKYISEINISKNFTVCHNLDSGHFLNNVDFLVDRLHSLGEKHCYDLGVTIEKLADSFNNLAFGAKEVGDFMKETEELDEYLNSNSTEPIAMYHYKSHHELGMILSKIGINKVLKDLTFQDDIRIFEEGMFLAPATEYFSYIIEYLENCFEYKKTLMIYLNTFQGVKKVYVEGKNFNLADERIVVFAIPKRLQSTEVQKLIESPKEIILNPKPLKKAGVMKSFWDWESLIKNYYDPKEVNREKNRCQYRIINKEGEMQDIKYSALSLECYNKI